MSETVIFVGDVGTEFLLTIVEKDGVTPVDVSSATVKTIYFKKPDGTKVTKTASFKTDGVDGQIHYFGIAGDIDQPRDWQMEGNVEMPAGKFSSEIVGFTVEQTIA